MGGRWSSDPRFRRCEWGGFHAAEMWDLIWFGGCVGLGVSCPDKDGGGDGDGDGSVVVRDGACVVLYRLLW